MRNYIAFARDHSGSMSGLTAAAAKDYNATIAAVREGSITNNQDTLVSVLEFGYGGTNLVRTITKHASVTALTKLKTTDYSAGGHGTPLFDAVGDAIELLEKVPDRSDPTVSFLVMVTTDGLENASRRWTSRSIADKIRTLQATDRWTFVFRVPRGSATGLIRFGVPAHNILEWEQTLEGVETAQKATTTSFDSYFALRSTGVTSTQKFYANLENVSSAHVEQTLVDISKQVMLWPVAKGDAGAEIRPFVEARLKRTLSKGAAFYQLTKSEEVQEYKIILVRDKTTNAIYGGSKTRGMLGLPNYGKIRLAPDKLGNFDVFVQSTSVNRKLIPGSQVVYWEAAGK